MGSYFSLIREMSLDCVVLFCLVFAVLFMYNMCICEAKALCRYHNMLYANYDII